MRVIVNGVERELPDESTVGALVRVMQLQERGSAVAVDAAVVPRGQWDARVLVDGDQVEVVQAVQGG